MYVCQICIYRSSSPSSRTCTICLCVQMWMYPSTYVHICGGIQIFDLHAYICMLVRVYMYRCMNRTNGHTFTHKRDTCIHTHAYAYTNMYARSICHTRTHTHTHARAHTDTPSDICKYNMHVLAHAHAHTNTHTRTPHTCTRTHLLAHAHTHAHTKTTEASIIQFCK